MQLEMTVVTQDHHVAEITVKLGNSAYGKMWCTCSFLLSEQPHISQHPRSSSKGPLTLCQNSSRSSLDFVSRSWRTRIRLSVM